jgi:hypothetical protein
MTLPSPRFHELFNQLGLGSEDHHIKQFIINNSPLADDIRLADASFWSPTQASFLREAFLMDSEWAALVDQLNAALREPVREQDPLAESQA